MTRTRAYRRAQRQRKVAKARWVLKKWWPVGLLTDEVRMNRRPFLTEEYIEKSIRKHADNLHICSCSSCCNPRHCAWMKGERFTLQERRADEELRALLEI